MEIKPHEREGGGGDTPTTSLSSKQLPVPTAHRLGGQEQKQMLFESRTAVRNWTSAVPPTAVHALKRCLLYILKVYRKSTGARGGVMVEAPHYKPEGRGFDSRWCHWIFFISHNPSGRTMALGLTQPLTELSTRDISWG
jgi:hypothetical protein